MGRDSGLGSLVTERMQEDGSCCWSVLDWGGVSGRWAGDAREDDEEEGGGDASGEDINGVIVEDDDDISWGVGGLGGGGFGGRGVGRTEVMKVRLQRTQW